MDSLQADDLGRTYSDPVGRLLTIGKPASFDHKKWPDYAGQFGLGLDHVGELIRLACDLALHQADPDTAEAWAPMYAWRALGQLRADAATVPLLDLLATLSDDDMLDEELPAVFGMIGPEAVAPLAGFLSDRLSLTWAAVTAIGGLGEIAQRHPACRDDCVGILVRMLEPHAGADPTVRGFAVSALADLGAVEAIDAIRDAFGRDDVDISIIGDLEDTEIALGLRERRATPAPRYIPLPEGWSAQEVAERIRRNNAPPPVRSVKVGRNDPCPCGSGKKYKKCCLQ